MGLLTASGLGVDYTQEIRSNGTAASMSVLQTAVGAGPLTDRFSVGFQGTVGSASMDGIFASISSATPAYNLRAALGFSYELMDSTTIGGYWHTEQKFTFDNFVQVPPSPLFQDFSVSLPNKYGLGIADESLMDGKLLVAVDLMYFNWSDTDFFGACGRTNLRCRPVFNTRPTMDISCGRVPDITPALPLFAQLRRFTLAVLAAAETAAEFAGILYTDAPANGEADSAEPFEPIELEKRMLLTMPGGWKMAQMKSEQPSTTYAEFKKEILNEIARCLNMPFNVAAGNSRGYRLQLHDQSRSPIPRLGYSDSARRDLVVEAGTLLHLRRVGQSRWTAIRSDSRQQLSRSG